ncbi:MAG: ABC transporter permease [Candidatus Helarchaeota archaeon]
MIELDLEAIKGIAKREIIKYFRNKNQIFSSMLMPTIFMIFLRPGFATLAGGGDFSSAFGAYMGAGIICLVLVMSGIMMSGMPVLFDKMLGFQDIYAVAPVKRRNVVLGFIVGGALKSTFQCTLIIIIGVISGLFNPFLGVYPSYWLAPFPLSILTVTISILPLYFTIFFGASIYACIGLCVAARTDMTNAMLWIQVIQMPLVFISGALLPVENFGPAAVVALFNPTTYFADAVRVWLGGQTGIAGPIGYNVSLLLGYLVDLAIIGAFGALMFFAVFKIFGSSLTESAGGFTAIFHKKTADAQKKMYKDLTDEEREVMNILKRKLDGTTMIRTFMLQSDGKMDEVFKIYKQNGITDEEIKKIMEVGQKMMQKRMAEVQKKRKKDKK